MGRVPIRYLFGWFCYFASAVPFVFFVVDSFLFSGLGREPANIIAVNASIFAAAGVTAVLVKNMAFNALMALNAIPYTDFLVDHLGINPSMWTTNDIEGSVHYVSIYCILGIISTAVWLLSRGVPAWRRLLNAYLR